MADSGTAGGRVTEIRGARRLWAVAAVHGEAGRLAALHDRMAADLTVGDRIVYLGNYFGHGAEGRAVLDELLRFRRWFLSFPPYADVDDIVFLRGAQEEMWVKLKQLQFAPDPQRVLDWMAARGMAAAARAFGADLEEAREAARAGTLALTYWCNRVREQARAVPGHDAFIDALSRAACTAAPAPAAGGAAANDGAEAAEAAGTGRVLFVHAGLDAGRPLDRQADAFWWAARSFEAIEAPYGPFARIVRGYDPDARGVVDRGATLSLDAGAGRGGPLTAVRLDPAGRVETRYSV